MKAMTYHSRLHARNHTTLTRYINAVRYCYSCNVKCYLWFGPRIFIGVNPVHFMVTSLAMSFMTEAVETKPEVTAASIGDRGNTLPRHPGD